MNLEQFCHRFQAFLKKNPEKHRLLEEGQKIMQELLHDGRWFGEVLRKLILDRKFYHQQEASIYPNEITVYRSSDPYFSILAYLWEPDTTSNIHDHGSWGIVGSMFHPFKETKYRRLDDGRKEGYAELEPISSAVIEPGNTTSVLPLDEGIHLMRAATREMTVSLSVYGKTIRPGYIQFFNPDQKRATRIYPPLLFKKVLAIRLLSSVSDPWAQEIWESAMTSSEPDYLRKELLGSRPKTGGRGSDQNQPNPHDDNQRRDEQQEKPVGDVPVEPPSQKGTQDQSGEQHQRKE